MCKAHVLRFSCSHGVLMSLELCRIGPCPMLKTTGLRLPQQPYKCYNCQHKQSHASLSGPTKSSRNSAYGSSQESLISSSSTSSFTPHHDTYSRKSSLPSHPLPGVAVQPAGCTKLRRTPQSTGRSFSFSCNGSSHFPTPHYSDLPEFLPHQDHSCPPCQLEEMRQKADADVVADARQQYPSLTAEMLVHDGRAWEEWQTKPSLDKFVDEKRTEEREMWLHVTRKWTQDLRKVRVLVAEEDGLGLLG